MGTGGNVLLLFMGGASGGPPAYPWRGTTIFARFLEMTKDPPKRAKNANANPTVRVGAAATLRVPRPCLRSGA